MTTAAPNMQPTFMSNGFSPSDVGLNLPAFRPQQLAILRRILLSKRKFHIVDAAPGVGKTLVAEALSAITQERTVYTTVTKALQDQVLGDLKRHTILDKITDASKPPWYAVLKGRNAYPVLNMREEWPRVSAEHCVQGRKVERKGQVYRERHCPYCCDGPKNKLCGGANRCPYIVDRRAMMKAMFAVLNLSIFLHLSEMERRTPVIDIDDITSRAHSLLRSPWLILDEADLIEQAVLGFQELAITQTMLKKLELSPPESKATTDHTEQVWANWIRDTLLPRANARQQQLENQGDTESAQEDRWLQGTIVRMKRFLDDYKKHPWVFIPEELTFRPVFAAGYTQELLWDKADKVVLMSGTVISADQLCKDLCIPRGDAQVISIDSPWDPARRPVYVAAAASMSHKLQEYTLPSVISKLDETLDRHREQKVLVHTVSYQTAKAVLTGSRHRDRMLTYTNPALRGHALNEFKASLRPLVFVAPSMDRGVSLDDDAARAVVVLKVPYPNLNDRQVAARLYPHQRYPNWTRRDGELWYAVQTIRTLVQMTMRHIRSEDDWGISYLIDADFAPFYERYRHLFPEWWRTALHLEEAGGPERSGRTSVAGGER